MRSLLAIASINELSSRPIDFLLAFIQADLDVDVFIYILLGMGVDEKRGVCTKIKQTTLWTQASTCKLG